MVLITARVAPSIVYVSGGRSSDAPCPAGLRRCGRFDLQSLPLSLASRRKNPESRAGRGQQETGGRQRPRGSEQRPSRLPYPVRHLSEQPAMQRHVLPAIGLYFDQGRRVTGTRGAVRFDEVLDRAGMLVGEVEHFRRWLEAYALRRAEVKLEELLVPGDG